MGVPIETEENVKTHNTIKNAGSETNENLRKADSIYNTGS